MPTRAPTGCTNPGCPATQTDHGRCAGHPHLNRWADGTPGRRMPPGWPATRARILTRDGHRCRSCGAPASEVHHTRRGIEADEFLVSLCERCHERITQIEAARARAARRLAALLTGTAIAPISAQNAERARALRLAATSAPLGSVGPKVGGGRPRGPGG
jgi:5-methylcytosine-specific restriction enzyme A